MSFLQVEVDHGAWPCPDHSVRNSVNNEKEELKEKPVGINAWRWRRHPRYLILSNQRGGSSFSILITVTRFRTGYSFSLYSVAVGRWSCQILSCGPCMPFLVHFRVSITKDLHTCLQTLHRPAR